MSGKPMQIHPARAKRVSERRMEDVWDSPIYYAEPKLDGWRFLMHYGGGLDRMYLTGRRTSVETGELSEKGELVEMLTPTEHFESGGLVVLDGEIMPPSGAGFRDIAGLMNADPDTVAARIREIGCPTYHVFDVLFYDGEDQREKSQLERRLLLESLFQAGLIATLPIDDPRYSDPLRLVPRSYERRATYDKIVADGGEGVILKDLEAPYGEGWIKVKKYSTLEVIVTGFTAAKHGVTGKYDGQIGAAIVSVLGSLGELLEVGQVSGMTDEIRLDMTRRPEVWIGSVIEIHAQEFAKLRLRHPRFHRARPDADRNAATFAKMMIDLGQEEAPEAPDPRQTSLF